MNFLIIKLRSLPGPNLWIGSFAGGGTRSLNEV